MNHKLKKGHSQPFNGEHYDLYALFSGVSYQNNKPRPTGFSGYRLVRRERFTTQPISSLPSSVGMYFIYSKEER